jgi:putative oxidoreductase
MPGTPDQESTMNAIAASVIDFIGRPVNVVARGLDLLQPVFTLAIRLWVGLQFWKSGLTKIESWDTTLYLFREEYHTPLLPPELAAVLGTAGELAFPVLLWPGLFGRLGAVGLSIVNAMAVVSYAHVLLAEGYEAALAQHVLWGFMLLVIVVYGPGRLSADHLLFRRHQPARAI